MLAVEKYQSTPTTFAYPSMRYSTAVANHPLFWSEVWSRLEWKKSASPGSISTYTCSHLYSSYSGTISQNYLLLLFTVLGTCVVKGFKC